MYTSSFMLFRSQFIKYFRKITEESSTDWIKKFGKQKEGRGCRGVLCTISNTNHLKNTANGVSLKIQKTTMIFIKTLTVSMGRLIGCISSQLSVISVASKCEYKTEHLHASIIALKSGYQIQNLQL